MAVIAVIPVRPKSTPGVADRVVQSIVPVPVTVKVIDTDFDVVDEAASVTVSGGASKRATAKSYAPLA